MLLHPGQFWRIFVNVGSEATDDGFEVRVRRDPGIPQPQPMPSIRVVCEDQEALGAVVNVLKPDGFTRFVGEAADGPMFRYVPATLEDLGRAIGRLGPTGPRSVTLIVADASDEAMVARIADAQSALRRIQSRLPA